MSKKSPYILIVVITLFIVLITVLNIVSKNTPRDENSPEPFPKGDISAIFDFVDTIEEQSANGHGFSE